MERMNSFGVLSILFLILVVLAVILIYLQRKEYFRDLISPSPQGMNTNNNSSNYQFANKSPYKHFLKNTELTYLGWNKWWNQHENKACVQSQNLPPSFKNYLQNTPLKYDGLWKKDVQRNYYTWKLDV